MCARLPSTVLFIKEVLCYLSVLVCLVRVRFMLALFTRAPLQTLKDHGEHPVLFHVLWERLGADRIFTALAVNAQIDWGRNTEDLTAFWGKTDFYESTEDPSKAGGDGSRPSLLFMDARHIPNMFDIFHGIGEYLVCRTMCPLMSLLNCQAYQEHLK